MSASFDFGQACARAAQPVKCVVWDLDNTLWRGTLAEGDQLELRQEAVDAIRTLDARGILQSIASKNEPQQALAALKKVGLQEYFLYPQIGWGPKSESIGEIAKSLNIAVDSFAFVDDQPFERDEVQSRHPAVLCIDASDVASVVTMPEMMPRFLTDDSRQRRRLYQSDAVRNALESKFEGPRESFLATLDMRLRIHRATEEDLRRAEELTVRTHQLNSTGYTYSYDELEQFQGSEKHLLLVADLKDKYGPYGKVGLALLALGQSAWTIKLLLMSCRVMSRGVGGVLITHLRQAARDSGVQLQAEFVPTEVNRMMYMTYRFAEFREIGKRGPVLVLESDLSAVPAYPDYYRVVVG